MTDQQQDENKLIAQRREDIQGLAGTVRVLLPGSLLQRGRGGRRRSLCGAHAFCRAGPFTGR